MTDTLPTLQNMPNEIPVFGGVRLTNLSAEDATAIDATLARDPAIRQRITWVHGLQGAEAIAQAITTINPANDRRYGIRQEDDFVGYITLSAGTAEDKPRTYYISYFLDENKRGLGIIRKAVAGVLSAALTYAGASQFRANIADDNTASQRVVSDPQFEKTDVVVWDATLQAEERRWEKVIDD